MTPWTCPTCTTLGTGTSNGGHNADPDLLLPPAAKPLLKAGDGLLRCPECFTHYRASTTYDADAGGAWVDLDLVRLAPGQVRALLGAGFPEHDAVIAALERAHEERVPAARDLAADGLFDHHARAGNWARAEELLRDPATRGPALSALLRHVTEFRALPDRVLAGLAPFAKEQVREVGPARATFPLGQRLAAFGLRIPPASPGPDRAPKDSSKGGPSRDPIKPGG